MNVESFVTQSVVNPTTDEKSQRIAVKFDNGEVLKLLLRDNETLPDVVKYIKEHREDAKKRIVVRPGEYGRYCVLSRAITVEEF